MRVVRFFKPWDEYGWMSSWSKHAITENGIEFKTCEHYLAYHTAFKEHTRRRILRSELVGEARYISRREVGDPDAHRVFNIMTRAVDLKIKQHVDVRQALVRLPSHALIEYTAPYDLMLGCNGRNILGLVWQNALRSSSQHG